MAKFKLKELVGSQPITVRLGAGSVYSTPANAYTDKEIGKFAKLSGDSAYVLCVVGDPIQAVITAVETYNADDFSIGSVGATGRKRVLLDGSEAAGTGSIAIGDYVVTGTPVAKDTALTILTPPKVRKATNQPGAVPGDLTAAGKQALNSIFAWRLVSFDSAGAVGDFGVIERVNQA
jgi:hypothetical protein